LVERGFLGRQARAIEPIERIGQWAKLARIDANARTDFPGPSTKISHFHLPPLLSTTRSRCAIPRSPKAIFSGRGKIALEFGLRRSREQRKLGLQPHGVLSFSKQSNLESVL
jgi:hypothetical protein